MNEQPSSDAQFDFLRAYIERLLDDNGFAAVKEDVRAQYIPQFVGEAQRRLGLAVLPLLDKKAADALAALLEDPNMTQEDIQAFWKTNVPNFESVVQKTLMDFAEELKGVLAQIRS